VRYAQTFVQKLASWRFAALAVPPPQVARALAIVHTCMFDAWAAFDARAGGTMLGARLRRPVYERTEWNKAEAISVAAHRALVDLFPSKRIDLFDPLMAELGYTSRHSLADLSTPAGIGYAAVDAVIAFRHHDGANQLGELSPSGLPYADYTGYAPANDPLTLTDPNRWQPLPQADGNPQRFLVPHWGRVTPFALTGSSQFRPAAPAAHGTRAYWKQALELAYTSATLNDRTKAIAVYWADGPSTETPPGHWMLFAQAVSRRDRHTIDKDVKMFFALGNALLDASIAAWDCKVAFDYVRPTSALRLLFAGHTIPAWSGPFRGTEMIDGSTWQSYIPTPPFAEHVSGHSTFSAAAATVLRRFTWQRRHASHRDRTCGCIADRAGICARGGRSRKRPIKPACHGAWAVFTSVTAIWRGVRSADRSAHRRGRRPPSTSLVTSRRIEEQSAVEQLSRV